MSMTCQGQRMPEMRSSISNQECMQSVVMPTTYVPVMIFYPTPCVPMPWNQCAREYAGNSVQAQASDAHESRMPRGSDSDGTRVFSVQATEPCVQKPRKKLQNRPLTHSTMSVMEDRKLDQADRDSDSDGGMRLDQRSSSVWSAATTVPADECGNLDSLLDRTSSVGSAMMPLSQIIETVQEARIGVDIGGVLTNETRGTLCAVGGSLDGVRALVAMFGRKNVVIISKVKGQSMRTKIKTWIRESRFHERTGVLTDNLHFVLDVDGINGKGVVAQECSLSYFVDDTWEVLESVFSDPAGNCGKLVQEKNGLLFHFDPLGARRRTNVKDDMAPHYCAVSCWPEVIERLRNDGFRESSYERELPCLGSTNPDNRARLCRQFLKGQCELGEACEFRHLVR